jgi:hypothetical protein
MSNLIASLMLGLAVVSMNAAAVTIDFEEFSIGDGAGPGGLNTVLQSKGFDFTGNQHLFGAESTEILNGVSGSKSYGGSASGYGEYGYGWGTLVVMTRSDGGLFALYDLDLFIEADADGYVSIRGETSGGISADLSAPIGTGDWLNLESIRFNASGEGWGYGTNLPLVLGYGTVELDNIVVSAVPIPAAAWLFASGLIGLGCARRKLRL